MSVSNIYRQSAQECLQTAQSAENERERTLWLTMAQSWVRLAEQVDDLADQSLQPQPSYDEA